MLWLDAAKALGIACVVAGHVFEGPGRPYLFLWHMPFFFFLSGYVFKADPDVRRCLKDKAIRLLVPYAFFLVLLSQPDITMAVHEGTPKAWLLFVASHLAGGKSVYGWLAAFWFVTCLYLSQVLVNIGVVRLTARAMEMAMVASLALAYVLSMLLPGFWLPWDANVCLFAAPVLYAGYRYRQLEARIPRGFQIAAMLLAAFGLWCVSADLVSAMDMKRARYGTPLAALFFALCISVTLMNVARLLLDKGRLAQLLAFVGEASLLIMFLHQPVQRLLAEQFNVDDESIRTAVGILLPTLIYAAVREFQLGRTLLLGSRRDFRAMDRSFRKRFKPIA
jgi:fucose 4-O-acetylase-like acetyltransferase